MNNIVLIGMPGAGKSTLGVILAKKLAKAFVDTDLLIQHRAGKTLQAVVDEQGYGALRALEEDVLVKLQVSGTVIATGGSAVYSDNAMRHLKKQAVCIYLRLSLESVEARVNNLGSRGIAAEKGMSLADIYKERRPLYQHYADITIDCDGVDIESLVDRISACISS